MKKIKILILSILVILLTGCSGSYDLKINEDLSVNEKLNLSLDTKDDTYYKAVKLFENNKIKKDKYKIVNSDNKVKITYNDKFDSIEDYILNSKLYKNMFDNINYEKNEKNLKINTNSVFDNINSNSPFVNDEYDISLFQINIETPYKVSYTNADQVDENIMTWNINKDTTYKDISFDMDINDKQKPYLQIIILILIGFIIIISTIIVINRFKQAKKI